MNYANEALYWKCSFSHQFDRAERIIREIWQSSRMRYCQRLCICSKSLRWLVFIRFAFVLQHMEDASKAKASIAALNDFNLKGSRIRVEVSLGSRWDVQERLPSIDRLGFDHTTATSSSSIVISLFQFLFSSHFAFTRLVADPNLHVTNQVRRDRLGKS